MPTSGAVYNRTDVQAFRAGLAPSVVSDESKVHCFADDLSANRGKRSSVLSGGDKGRGVSGGA